MRWEEITEGSKPNYNLQAKYDEFNTKFFNGELPKIPLVWRVMKNVGGHVKYSLIRKGPPPDPRMVRAGLVSKYKNTELKQDSMKLTMSSTQMKTEEQFDGVLLHEMVHVWFVSIVHDYDMNHGSAFVKKIKELSAISGIDIPLRDTITSEVAIDDKLVFVLLNKKENGEYNTVILPISKINDLTPIIKQRIIYLNYWASSYLYMIKTKLWTQKSYNIPTQRKFDQNTKYYKVTTEEVNDLLQNGKLIWEYNKGDV
jgi:hypothetical protein